MIVTIAAVIAVVVFGVVSIIQLLLALGKPLGKLAYGGKYETLPSNMRIMSVGAIGIFASSLTRNQVIAFITGMTICFALTLLTDFLLYFIPNTFIGFFQYFSANFHFQNISRGLIDSRDILYFITISFIALYGANLVMKEKK